MLLFLIAATIFSLNIATTYAAEAETDQPIVIGEYDGWETEYAPKNPGDAWHPLFLEAVQRKSYVEYLTDTLLLGTEQE